MKHSLSTPAGTSSFRTPPDYPLNQRRRLLSVVLLLAVLVFGTSSAASAADRYVRAGATGANNGTDWTNAYTSLPASLTRGDTYYVADGTYSSQTFDDPLSGTSLITIKKATVADHGTNTGWDNSYGDGQAVLGSTMTFNSSYYVVDGNGTHTVPSDNTNDYGFKISSDTSTNITGIVRIGSEGSTVSQITIKYTHIYNTTNGSINNGTVSVRWYPSGSQSYIKLQNCFIENSGKDGLQISTSRYILVERSYIKRLGKLQAESPDYHGQTVQIFYGGDDIIFRWNVWEANEGQGLIQIAGIGSTTDRVRFYGNVVFVDYGKSPSTPGFNTSGGIFGDAWTYNPISDIFVYNNTFVNIGGDYGGVAAFPILTPGTNLYNYNNLFYNCQSTSRPGWTAYGYHASGGGDTAGGTSEQTGLSSSNFANYTGNNFNLSSATAAGLRLTAQPWWQDSSDSFFGQVDSDLDLLGNTRGADGLWDRGAFEYVAGASTRPAAPTGLTVN